jgi:2-polyprenyl-6-methoxyphenol hydroxylase-like FAD-dependent oxidoreductase
MANDSTTDVLVVGAGPTGLLLTAELARHGVSCRLIDRNEGPIRLSRAIGIHARTMEIFEQIGLIDDLLAVGLRCDGFSQYARGSRIFHVEFAGVETPYPFVVCLQQDRTEDLLERHLTRTSGMVPERRTELTGLSQDADGATATLRHADGQEETVRARWVVGCDGAHSTVRHTVGLPFEGSAYPTVFALADVKAEWPYPHDEVMVFHHPEGLTAVFPLPEPGRYRLVCDVTGSAPPGSESAGHGPLSSKLPPPTLEDVQRILDRRVAGKVVLSEPHWLAHFGIHCRQVPRYREGRVFLAGDAAHIHSPIGGQGMNTGLQDAHNLAWKLALASRGLAMESLLDSYSEERHAVGKLVLQNTDRGTKMLTASNPFARLFRGIVLRLVPRIGSVRSALLRTMMQVGLNYRGTPLVGEEGGPSRGPRAGDRAPDAALGGRRFFQAIARSTHYHLLAFASADRAKALVTSMAPAAGLVDVHWAAPDAVAAAAFGEGALVDVHGQLRHRYGADIGEALYLIRPDGYVGFRAGRADAGTVLAHLRRCVALPA